MFVQIYAWWAYVIIIIIIIKTLLYFKIVFL